MPMLPQALQALQQPQPQLQPSPSPQGMTDPVQMLMDEYERLAPKDEPAKSPYTPEQQHERINRNDNLASLGVLGTLAGDRGISGVGAQVFKQALGERAPRKTIRGTVDPVTGEEQIDPGYLDARREQQRGQVLSRAIAYSQARQAAQDRAATAGQHDQTLREIAAARGETAMALKALGGAAGGGHNLTQVTDETTGKVFWADPRTGNYVKPVTNEAQTPIVKPGKVIGTDDKELTSVATGLASVNMGREAVKTHPEAFGPVKGIPDQLGPGVVGGLARYYRDNKQLTPDQVTARSAIYNNVSAVIKERAGTAQSAQELKRLQGFLPSEFDSAPAIQAKLDGFEAYLKEKGIAVRSKYAGPRPMQHAGGYVGGTDPNPNAAPTSAPAPTGRLVFNPATGELEPK